MCPFNFKDIWERICQATGWQKQWELAKTLGIKPASVSGAKSRDCFPVEWAFKVAQKVGLSTDWIMTGEGPMFRGGTKERGKCGGEGSCYQGDDSPFGEYTLVPHLNIGAKTDGESNQGGSQMIECLQFKTDWLKDGLGLDPYQLALITITMDFMAPTFQANDILLLDLRRYSVGGDGIFGIRLKETLHVRRLQSNIDGSAYVIPDNTSYKSQLVPPEQVDQLDIIGRVVWCGRKT